MIPAALCARAAAAEAPDRVALVDDAGALTWSDVAAEVERRLASLPLPLAGEGRGEGGRRPQAHRRDPASLPLPLAGGGRGEGGRRPQAHRRDPASPGSAPDRVPVPGSAPVPDSDPAPVPDSVPDSVTVPVPVSSAHSVSGSVWDAVSVATPTQRTTPTVAITPTPDRDGVLWLITLLGLDVRVVLLHPRWTDAEREDALERTRPDVVVRDGEIELRASSSPHPVDPDDVVVFTSGSTGRPKAALLPRGALLAAAAAHAAALPWRDDDRWLLAMPLAHVGGLSIVTRALHSRTSIAIGPPRFDPDGLVDAATRHRATLLSVVPTMLARLLDARRAPPPALRAALVGGAACSPELLRRGREAGWPLLPTYGTTETCAQICTQRLGDERPDGVGPPLPGVRVRIVDGAIEVGGPTLMRGFLEPPSPFVDAWYRTGDLGVIDDSGHLHVRGRADRRIVTGGENVDPAEVEAALREHPAVRDACVVGLDDATWGQRVGAAVVTSADPAALRAFLEPRLAGFKHPREWAVLDALPETPSGKVDLAAVRRRLRSIDRGL